MAKPKNQNQAAPAEKPAELERARNPDGTFVGDDPATPDVNEAYVQTPDTAEQTIEQGQGEGGQADHDKLDKLDNQLQPGAFTATEDEQPEGVVTTEQIPAEEAAFVVLSHIKHNGRRYQPGEDVAGLTADDAARMLRSGSIQPKE